MRISEENYKKFNTIKEKYSLKNEGILSFIFKKKLKKALDNDKELQNALEDADKSLENLKKSIKDLEKKGYKIPDELKRFY
jgi:hypothetical protein